MGRKKKRELQRSVQLKGIKISLAIFSLLLGLLLIFGLLNKAGIVGNTLYNYALRGLGDPGAIFAAIVLIYLPLRFFFKKRVIPKIADLFLLLLTFAGLIGSIELLDIGRNGGGYVGREVGSFITTLFGEFIGLSILLGLATPALVFLFRRNSTFMNLISRYFSREDGGTSRKKITIYENGEAKELEIDADEEEDLPDEMIPQPELSIKGMDNFKKKPDIKEEASARIIKKTNTAKFFNYNAPPVKLLSKTKGKPSVGDIKQNAVSIQKTLKNFNIHVDMDEVTVGPTITRYAIKPAPGIRLSKIVSLQTNLELALASQVRIEAPIPGKSLVGVEIPNRSKSIIGLASIFIDTEFRESQKPLLFTLGKDVAGKTSYAELSKMPHLLIAGATGAGKSVTVHNIIASLLYRNGPQDLKFIMVDPKRVELTLYDKIPHLLTPVIKTAKKTILALKWAVKEMERRYDVLEQNKKRDIHSYHKTVVEPAYEGLNEGDDISELPERMPYIVVIIDELADIMQAYPRELESAIVRLAQMSRAVGIHLILSTQRPSVNVITGLIKANIPARIALRVSSQVDSRTIIDMAGAEKLLGKGDMLYMGSDAAKPTRLQCPYISEDEVKNIVKYIVKNNEPSLGDEIDLPDNVDDSNIMASGSISSDEDDELINKAKDIILEEGKGSTSLLQRKLRIGYARAARLIDILEENGIVGPADGSKPREVLVGGTMEEEENSFGYEDES